MRAAGLVCLGAGAGLIRGDLRDVRGGDVACRAGGVIVTVRGARPRTVPVLARCHARLLAAARFAGTGLVCGGTDLGRRNITNPLIRALDGRHWPARRPTMAAPRRLRSRDRLGTPPHRERTTAGAARSLRRWSRRHPHRRQSRRRPQGRRSRPRRAPRAPGRQLPQPAGLLPAARTDLRPGDGRPAGMGAGHRHSRHLAIAADAELRRRHPDCRIEPIRSAEPGPVGDVERQHPELIPHHRSGETTWIRDLELQQRAFQTGMNESSGCPSHCVGSELVKLALSAWESVRSALLCGLTCAVGCPRVTARDPSLPG